MEKTSKQRAIKKTAKELFFKYGIKRVSVEEISEKAGVSKVTFYKYYKNKMELAFELRDELLDHGFSHFDNINKQDIPFMEKINQMTRWQLKFYSQMNNEFVKEMALMKDAENEYKKRFLANLKSGQETGEIRQDINLEFVYLMTRQLHEITKAGLWKEHFSDFIEYIKQVRTIIFYGLLERFDENATKGK